MMKWIFTALIMLSVAFGLLNGRGEALGAAALSSCQQAVELAISLCGALCLWSGLMRAAQESGLTSRLARILSPVIGKLFRGAGPKAMELIAMNITANLLGLGNAATPLGLAAIQELEQSLPPEHKGAASDPMILLVVLNTASIQLIPTTVAVLRLKYGSENPMDIIPAVLISSLVSVTVGLFLAKVLNRLFPFKAERQAAK